LRTYFGDSIQRMVITDALLAMAEWLIPAAKSLLWGKGGHPSELDTMRLIEMWNFFGINSYWQQRGEQIQLNMSRWVRSDEPSQRFMDSTPSDLCIDLEHAEQLASIPADVLTDMKNRVRLRKTPRGNRYTVTLANSKGRARKGTFEQPDDLYLSLYQEYGELWNQFIITTTPSS